jgi:hypothetical protein
MIWLPETFRKERSLAWRQAMQRARGHARADRLRARDDLPKAIPTDRQPRTAYPERDTPASPVFPALFKVMTALSGRSGDDNVKIHFRDVNVSPLVFLLPFFFVRSATEPCRPTGSLSQPLGRSSNNDTTSSRAPTAGYCSLRSTASRSRHHVRLAPRLITARLSKSGSSCLALGWGTLCVLSDTARLLARLIATRSLAPC